MPSPEQRAEAAEGLRRVVAGFPERMKDERPEEVNAAIEQTFQERKSRKH